MDLAILGAFLGWLMNRQNAYPTGPYPCRMCYALVRYDKGQKDWVHPDGQTYNTIPSTLEGVTAIPHPALPAFDW